jgi:hypothetical protein
MMFNVTDSRKQVPPVITADMIPQGTLFTGRPGNCSQGLYLKTSGGVMALAGHDKKDLDSLIWDFDGCPVVDYLEVTTVTLT